MSLSLVLDEFVEVALNTKICFVGFQAKLQSAQWIFDSCVEDLQRHPKILHFVIDQFQGLASKQVEFRDQIKVLKIRVSQLSKLSTTLFSVVSQKQSSSSYTNSNEAVTTSSDRRNLEADLTKAIHEIQHTIILCDESLSQLSSSSSPAKNISSRNGFHSFISDNFLELHQMNQSIQDINRAIDLVLRFGLDST